MPYPPWCQHLAKTLGYGSGRAQERKWQLGSPFIDSRMALGAVNQERLSIASALLNLARTSGNMFSMAVTVLLVSLFLGDQQISPEQYPELLDVVRLGFIIALISTLIAAWFSFNRGDVER